MKGARFALTSVGLLHVMVVRLQACSGSMAIGWAVMNEAAALTPSAVIDVCVCVCVSGMQYSFTRCDTFRGLG